MKKKYIEVTRRARYFQSKDIEENVKQVIFLLHGYAQNGDTFLESCKSLASEEIVLIAPEGLSKFYWKDFTSDPASSWMTSLERENELADTMDYLSKVLMEIKSQLPKEGIAFHCLGFSQGAATASRFACNPHLNCQNLFLYGGAPAHDINWEALPQDLNFHLVYGKQDPLINASQVEKVKGLISSRKFEVHEFSYEGKHKVEWEGLAHIQTVLASF